MININRLSLVHRRRGILKIVYVLSLPKMYLLLPCQRKLDTISEKTPSGSAIRTIVHLCLCANFKTTKMEPVINGLFVMRNTCSYKSWKMHSYIWFVIIVLSFQVVGHLGLELKKYFYRLSDRMALLLRFSQCFIRFFCSNSLVVHFKPDLCWVFLFFSKFMTLPHWIVFYNMSVPPVYTVGDHFFSLYVMFTYRHCIYNDLRYRYIDMGGGYLSKYSELIYLETVATW